jgi:hypothetical protein
MSWKSAFTVGLILILLNASFRATLCDASCGAIRLHNFVAAQTCAHEHGMDSMSYARCAHMTKSDSGIGTVASLEASSACTHTPCQQPDILVDRPKSTALDRIQSAAVYPIALSNSEDAVISFVSEGPPPSTVPVPFTLFVALRI